ncbi:hypothetical protein [Treponema zioleckii]|uniref:hypothetical protein n=1 Tax=Treponema zioleckii TaxID=331680 RepID=UPI00168C06CF|nr:hypothetical protein [Treponema zioleckii]
MKSKNALFILCVSLLFVIGIVFYVLLLFVPDIYDSSSFLLKQESTAQMLENLSKLPKVEEVVLVKDDSLVQRESGYLCNSAEIYLKDGKFISVSSMGENLGGKNFGVDKIGDCEVKIFYYNPQRIPEDSKAVADSFFFSNNPVGNASMIKFDNLKTVIDEYDLILLDILRLPNVPEDFSFLKKINLSDESYFFMKQRSAPLYLRRSELEENLKNQPGVKTVSFSALPYSYEENYTFNIEMADGNKIEFVTTAVKKDDLAWSEEEKSFVHIKDTCKFHIKKFNDKELRIHMADWSNLEISKYFSNEDVTILTGKICLSYSDFFENWDLMKLVMRGRHHIQNRS